MSSSVRKFTDPDRAVDHIGKLYSEAITSLQQAFDDYVEGRVEGPIREYYPRVEVDIVKPSITRDKRDSYGFMTRPGKYVTTITRPDLFDSYLREQFSRIVKNHDVQIGVGISTKAIPIHFAFDSSTNIGARLSAEQVYELPYFFTVADAFDAGIDNKIVDGLFDYSNGEMPLALFEAPRVDKSLSRISHYTGTKPDFFQDFIIFTNYADYIQRFREMAKGLFSPEITEAKTKLNKDAATTYLAFIEPGNVITFNENIPDVHEKFNHVSGAKPFRLPQMPGYHLVREDGQGISMVNIGVGPSNAANMTDHLAVLRPHAFFMLGHCAGLTEDQRLGDYVLANAYDRRDGVLDEAVPLSTPIPALAEIQQAIKKGIAGAVGVDYKPDMPELKERYRTGTIVSDQDRNWEEAPRETLIRRFLLNRAVGLDMESATIATNGFRYRIPYGTLLCISDKPLQGIIKMPGMANDFYKSSVDQHFWAGILAMEALRDEEPMRLHSRKLRSFMEPACR